MVSCCFLLLITTCKHLSAHLYVGTTFLHVSSKLYWSICTAGRNRFPWDHTRGNLESDLFFLEKSRELELLLVLRSDESTKRSKTPPPAVQCFISLLAVCPPTTLSLQWRLCSTHTSAAPFLLSRDGFKVRARHRNESRADPYRGGSVIGALYWRLGTSPVMGLFHHSKWRLFQSRCKTMFWGSLSERMHALDPPVFGNVAICDGFWWRPLQCSFKMPLI